jgi:hypothetical protein
MYNVCEFVAKEGIFALSSSFEAKVLDTRSVTFTVQGQCQSVAGRGQVIHSIISHYASLSSSSSSYSILFHSEGGVDGISLKFRRIV